MLVFIVIKKWKGLRHTSDGGGSSGQEESAEDLGEHCG